MLLALGTIRGRTSSRPHPQSLINPLKTERVVSNAKSRPKYENFKEVRVVGLAQPASYRLHVQRRPRRRDDP